MTQPDRLSLTIVVPLCDEAEAIAPLTARLAEFLRDQAAPRAIDVVFVDDGSRDDTHERLQRDALGLPCTILRHSTNRGLTAALATGSAAAEGQLVGWLDSDLTYDPAILSELAGELDRGADVAVASCYHPAGQLVGVSGWRIALSKLASRIYGRLTDSPIHTFTSMVRAYRREVLATHAARQTGFVGVTEILVRALEGGCCVVEVPATLRRRQVGRSKMRTWRVGRGHLRLMAALWWSRRRAVARRAAADPRRGRTTPTQTSR